MDTTTKFKYSGVISFLLLTICLTIGLVGKYIPFPFDVILGIIQKLSLVSLFFICLPAVLYYYNTHRRSKIFKKHGLCNDESE